MENFELYLLNAKFENEAQPDNFYYPSAEELAAITRGNLIEVGVMIKDPSEELTSNDIAGERVLMEVDLHIPADEKGRDLIFATVLSKPHLARYHSVNRGDFISLTANNVLKIFSSNSPELEEYYNNNM